jgi:hypothetical protein
MTFQHNSGVTSEFGLEGKVLSVDVQDLNNLGAHKTVEIIAQLTPVDYLVFGRFGDGVEKSAVENINLAVKIIVEQQLVPFEKIAYMSNIDACSANQAFYSQLCDQYKYLPQHLCHSANRENLMGQNPSLVEDPLPPLALTQGPKLKNFLCFNRGMRVPRLLFVAEMLNRGLDHSSFVSMDPVGQDAQSCRQQAQDLFNTWCNNWLAETGLDKVDLNKLLDRLPLSLNYSTDRLFALNQYDVSLFAQSKVSIVNEALYYYSHNHLLQPREVDFYPMCLTSEKLQKCFMLGHPFMCVGTPGQLKSLHQMGYKTFSNVIDEGYDNIAHDRDRMFAILTEMERLNKFTDVEWAQFINAVHDRVDHNREVFIDRHRHHRNVRWLNAA